MDVESHKRSSLRSLGGRHRGLGHCGRTKGSERDRGLLTRQADTVRAGQSRVLRMRGEPGASRTVLLEYALGPAPRTLG